MNRWFKRTDFIWNRSSFTVTFDQCNACLLNKSIYFFSKSVVDLKIFTVYVLKGMSVYRWAFSYLHLLVILPLQTLLLFTDIRWSNKRERFLHKHSHAVENTWVHSSLLSYYYFLSRYRPKLCTSMQSFSIFWTPASIPQCNAFDDNQCWV